MKDFKFIELPKEEVLSEVELSFIEGAENCEMYSVCKDDVRGSICHSYNTELCNGCAPGLYCQLYSNP